MVISLGLELASYTTDGANRVIGDGTCAFTWNGADRLVQRGADAFSYDALGRMTSSTIATFPTPTTRTHSYDGDGLLRGRTQGSSTTSYLWDTSVAPAPLLAAGTDRVVHGLGPLYLARPRIHDLDHEYGDPWDDRSGAECTRCIQGLVNVQGSWPAPRAASTHKASRV